MLRKGHSNKERLDSRDTVQEPATLVEACSASALLSNTSFTETLLIARFGKLLGDFGFAQLDEGHMTMFETAQPGKAVIKRKKIELVNGPPPRRGASE